MEKINLNNSDINIIDILKQKINRKVNEHVKHKASLRAFDDYIKKIGNNKTKLKQFNLRLYSLNKKINTLNTLFKSLTSTKRTQKIKETMAYKEALPLIEEFELIKPTREQRQKRIY